MPISYRANTETITATTAQTVTFADNTLPQGGIAEFFVVNTGANNALDNAIANNIRVKLEGVPDIDLTGAQLRCLLEALSPSSTPPATGQLHYTIPMSFPYQLAPVWAWPGNGGGIPFGVKVSVEQVTNASTSTGTSLPGWRLLPAPPQYMLKCLQQATGLVASTTNGRVLVNYGPNLVYGFILPIVGATGIARLRIVSLQPDGRELQVFHGSQGVILESSFIRNPQTITNPYFLPLPEPVTLPAGSYLEIDNGAGSAATDVFAALQVVNVAPAQSGTGKQ